MKGFTLIELLVVIAVMGVLATIVLVAVNPGAQIAKVRDAQRKSDLSTIRNVLEQFYIYNGHYPITGGYVSPFWKYSTEANPWIPGLDSYLKVIPKDPLNNIAGPWATGSYTYAYSSNGPHYNLVAQLENTSDGDRCQLKQYFRVLQDDGAGQIWCGTFSGQIYSVNDLGT